MALGAGAESKSVPESKSKSKSVSEPVPESESKSESKSKSKSKPVSASASASASNKSTLEGVSLKLKKILPKQYSVNIDEWSSILDQLHSQLSNLNDDQKVAQMREFGYDEVQFLQGSRSLEKTELLTDILLSLKLYPENIFPLKFQGKSQVVKKEFDLTNFLFTALALTDEGVTTLNETLMAKTSFTDRIETTYHEIGHQIDSNLGDLSYTESWRVLGGWDEADKMDPDGAENELDGANRTLAKFEILLRKGLISTYAGANSVEDFAESVTAYRFQGARFKSISPAKYQFIRTKVYGGVEYASVENWIK